MLSLQKNAVKGKLRCKPNVSVHRAVKAPFKRKLCLSQNLPRNLPEEMCSIMKQDLVPGSMPAKWVRNTVHLGLAPSCTGGC